MSNSELGVLRGGVVVAPAAANSNMRVSGEFAVVSPERRHASSAEFRDRRAIAAPVAASRMKRLFDIFASAAGLVFVAPLLVLIFFIVKSDGGPGVFVQRRVGRNGELFPCYKFRTMVPNAEQVLVEILNKDPEMKRLWDENRKLPKDPRVTRLGAFLRKKSLDELPQLFNVLRGDMSLIGPRPIVSEERECYGDDFRFYASTRPGITGAWQVSGRNEKTYAERVELDVEYVTTWTFAKDLKILFATVGAVASGRGAC